jgi:hypothetical protein
MRMMPILVAAILVPALAGCGRKIDQKAIEAKVAEAWRHCQIVIPEKVTIESDDGRVVRYSYVLRMREDGIHAHPGGFNCFKPDILLLQALANKDIHQLKKGTEIPVTREDPR